jgi:hypothetical protein
MSGDTPRRGSWPNASRALSSPDDRLHRVQPDLHEHEVDDETTIVLLAVPFSAVGAVWFLYALGYNVAIRVWVGLIALLGFDSETGIFMPLYRDLSYAEAKRGVGRSCAEVHRHARLSLQEITEEDGTITVFLSQRIGYIVRS